MVFFVQMLVFGESVIEGMVICWFKQEGDMVEFDEFFVEVLIDKVDIEIFLLVVGVLIKIIVQEDDMVEVGGEFVVIGDVKDVGEVVVLVFEKVFVV